MSGAAVCFGVFIGLAGAFSSKPAGACGAVEDVFVKLVAGEIAPRAPLALFAGADDAQLQTWNRTPGLGYGLDGNVQAETACERGLVNRVSEPAMLDQEIAKLTASILAKPAVAIAMGKQLFYRQIEMGIGAAYQLAGETMACNMMDEAALEGVQAFIDKREPSWRT